MGTDMVSPHIFVTTINPATGGYSSLAGFSAPPTGGRNRTQAGEGMSAKIPEGFKRPFPPSIRDANTLSDP
jgi:hypothetical protein